MPSPKVPIVGQEAVCPDGLGRVVRYDFNPPNRNITVSTYMCDRQCCWDASNVQLVQIKLEDNTDA